MRDEQNLSQGGIRCQSPMLAASEIRWTPVILPRLELADPLSMSETELLSYVCDLQGHTQQLRELLSVALERVADQTDDLSRKTRTIEALRAEVRSLREQAAA